MTDLRARILDAAYPMLTRGGVRSVSLELLWEAAGVAPEQFGLEFESLDQVAQECLARREREWTLGVVEAGARERGGSAEGTLLAIFDVFDEWFRRDDFEACTFINVLLEMGREHPLGQASAGYLANIRHMVARLADEAHLADPEEFSQSWHLLMKGAIISATEGDQLAAGRAKAMAMDLIARHRRAVAVAAVDAPDLAEEWAWLDEVDFDGAAQSPAATLSQTLLDPWEWPEQAEETELTAYVSEAVRTPSATGASNPLTLVVTETGWEWLILSGDVVHAVVRLERGELFCYPCSPDFGRLGPFSDQVAALRGYEGRTPAL